MIKPNEAIQQESFLLLPFLAPHSKDLEVLNLQIRNSLSGGRGGLFIDLSKRVFQFWALIGPLLSALEARDATRITTVATRIGV